jgi:hypothetical protein
LKRLFRSMICFPFPYRGSRINNSSDMDLNSKRECRGEKRAHAKKRQADARDEWRKTSTSLRSSLPFSSPLLSSPPRPLSVLPSIFPKPSTCTHHTLLQTKRGKTCET